MNSDNFRENILEPELAFCKKFKKMVSKLDTFRENISETELAADCKL